MWHQGWVDAREVVLVAEVPIRRRSPRGQRRRAAREYPPGWWPQSKRQDVLDYIDGAWHFLLLAAEAD